jgi:hypothetical protein
MNPLVQWIDHKKNAEKKKIKVYYSSKRRTVKVNVSKFCPTSERKHPLFKGEFRDPV